MDQYAWVREALTLAGTVLVRVSPAAVVLDVAGDCASVLGGSRDEVVGRSLSELQGHSARLAEAMAGAGRQWDEQGRGQSRSSAYVMLPDGSMVLRLPMQQRPDHGVVARLADHLPVMVAYVDRDLCFRFNNQAYQDFIGLTSSELAGQPVASVLDASSYAKIQPRFARALAGVEVSYEDALVLQDGRRAFFKVNYLPDIVDDGVAGFYAIIQDVSEYRSMIQLLRDVHTGVNRTDIETSEIVDMLLRDALVYLGLDIALVSEVVGEQYSVRWAASDEAPVGPGDTFPLGDTYCRLTLDACDVFATHHARCDERVSGHPCYQAFQLETYIGAPIWIEGSVWGTLNFSSARPRRQPFSEVDIELVRLLTGAVERVITNELDVARIKRERDELEDQALRDPLTGLPNRAQLDRYVDELIEECTSRGTGFALAVLDIDFFKQVNDHYGHVVGDQVLVWLGQAVEQCLRDGDLVARTGGEEFVIVMRHAALEEAMSAAQRVCQAISQSQIELADGQQLNITISMGVGAYTKGETFTSLFERVDQELYAAKHAGRNRVCGKRHMA
ncbi:MULTISPECIES: diguanylate cyclase [Halomonas]|uniref:bifunctional diguanylate cyclase/phosphodiesterase n=1 Tax=Halomonas TaxID=2745 RepID=UPI001A8DF0D3|nr:MULTISPECIES: diguanylate cyclase [Halomonas]MBN8413092.1 diguanylate cyclase [Halomonas litopenaei]MBY5924335.1 diguanylate cyclase [Halomonas sp. DP4Y7-2]MBY6231377.1 diguanylate cyclase [Halomonas sp. DP4Y7-1]